MSEKPHESAPFTRAHLPFRFLVERATVEMRDALAPRPKKREGYGGVPFGVLRTWSQLEIARYWRCSPARAQRIYNDHGAGSA